MPPKKKAANGYKLAEPLPLGTIVQNLEKKAWRLGPSIGQGGFGEIYCAQELDSKGDNYPYVVKVEPHSNGPLFVEISFYIRFGKPDAVESYRKEKGLKLLGMPLYLGSGSLEYKGEKYRFLVMSKFSTDLWKLFKQNQEQFPADTVFKIAIQMLDVLEYIHSCGYVHADLKAANILLGATKQTLNKQCYLVDFGLATKYSVEKRFKPDPKKAHNGTIEYLSRDAHQGVSTRRGDLEVLAYNMIQWLGGNLPWMSLLKDPKAVQASKEEHMATTEKMLKACFVKNSYPNALKEYLTYLHTLLFDTEPDYDFIKRIFLSGVKEAGGSVSSLLNFSESKSAAKKGGRGHMKTPVKSATKDEENESMDEEVPEPKRTFKKKKVSPILEVEVENGNANPSFVSTRKKIKRMSKSLQDLTSIEPPAGFTEAMKEVWRKKAVRENTAKGKTRKKPAGAANKVAQPSTSRAKRPGARKGKSPLTHGDVVYVEGGSTSDD